MNAFVIFLIILAIILVLVGIGVGIYFAFFRKKAPPPSTPPPSIPPGTTGPGGFLPLQPVNGNGGFLPLQPINGPTGACLQSFNNVLNATSFALRHTAGANAEGCPDGILDLWTSSNARVYLYLARNPNATPTDLLNNYNALFSDLYPNGITNNLADYNNSLWAIRAIPIPANNPQLIQFNRFWNQGVPPGLNPTISKPLVYPQANFTL